MALLMLKTHEAEGRRTGTSSRRLIWQMAQAIPMAASSRASMGCSSRFAVLVTVFLRFPTAGAHGLAGGLNGVPPDDWGRSGAV